MEFNDFTNEELRELLRISWREPELANNMWTNMGLPAGRLVEALQEYWMKINPATETLLHQFETNDLLFEQGLEMSL